MTCIYCTRARTVFGNTSHEQENIENCFDGDGEKDTDEQLSVKFQFKGKEKASNFQTASVMWGRRDHRATRTRVRGTLRANVGLGKVTFKSNPLL